MLLSEKRQPSGRWYVVNQFINTDPSTRPGPLVASPDDVEVFASQGGLVVDTRDLFRSLMLIRRGTLSASDLRDAMRKQRGLFLIPSVGPETLAT